MTWLTFYVMWEFMLLLLIGMVATGLKRWYLFFILYLPLYFIRYLVIDLANQFLGIHFEPGDPDLKGLAIMAYYLCLSLLMLYAYVGITGVKHWKYVLLLNFLVPIFTYCLVLWYKISHYINIGKWE